MRRPIAVRVVGPLQWIVLPALAVIAIQVVLATPVELFGLFKLPEPILPLVLAFSWPLIRPSILAPVALLGLGLFLDLQIGPALGLWALCLIGVYGVILAARNLLAGQETLVLFTWYTAVTIGMFVLAYVIVSLRVGNAPSLIALFLQVLPTLALFPFANMMIERFDDGDVRFR